MGILFLGNNIKSVLGRWCFIRLFELGWGGLGRELAFRVFAVLRRGFVIGRKGDWKCLGRVLELSWKEVFEDLGDVSYSYVTFKVGVFFYFFSVCYLCCLEVKLLFRCLGFKFFCFFVFVLIIVRSLLCLFYLDFLLVRSFLSIGISDLFIVYGCSFSFYCLVFFNVVNFL